MYEEKTFENILGTMLHNVEEQNPDLDIRVGSIIYTALAPIALELETVYRELNAVIEETFVETASKDYLIKHGDQLGVELNEATYGHFKGEFDVVVPIGSRFNLDKFNYAVIDSIETIYETNEDGSFVLDENGQKIPFHYVYELVCETDGADPNTYLGDLTPITYVENLSYAKLVSVLIYGEDEEDTESYRYRLQVHTKNPPIDGNVSQYDEWLSEYDGIGDYKTIPCWNGINTVKLMILNPENQSANTELIKEVQDYFDPPTETIIDDVADATYPQGRGMGNGKAPIGAIITVATATEIPVKIECQLTLKEGYTTPVGVQEAVNDYLQSIVLDRTTIGYMPISAEIYKAPSVDNVVSLRITVKDTVMDASVNPFISSVTIESDEIAVLDTKNSVWGV